MTPSVKVRISAQFPEEAAVSMRQSKILELVGYSTGGRQTSYAILDLRECFNFPSGILKKLSQSPKHCCKNFKCS